MTAEIVPVVLREMTAYIIISFILHSSSYLQDPELKMFINHSFQNPKDKAEA